MQVPFKFLLILIIFLRISLTAFSQTTTVAGGPAQPLGANEKDSELLYLHLDKPYYAAGDTIWFKAYLLNRATHLPSVLSGLIYVELVSQENVVVKRLMVPAENGLSWGDLVLDPDLLHGSYFIRGYTNGMRNFDSRLLFSRPVRIVRQASGIWMVSESHRADKSRVDLSLRLNSPDNQPYAGRDVEVSVREGNRSLLKKVGRTSAEGLMQLAFGVPDRKPGSPIEISLKGVADKGKNVSFILPLNRYERADVQFLPEGGSLVENLASVIGFKAIGEDGLGIDISGTIIDQDSTEVTSFSSLHKGMGAFILQPLKNRAYFAEVLFPDGTKRSFPLPEARSSGTVLHIMNLPAKDSLDLLISFSPDLAGRENRYSLIGQSGGLTVCTASITPRRAVFRTRIPKGIFHSGIAHFTLFDGEQVPLNERQIFIDHDDDLRIEVKTDHAVYAARDSIPLEISVRDASGNEADGSFSVSVTDDSQVSTSFNRPEDIVWIPWTLSSRHGPQKTRASGPLLTSRSFSHSPPAFRYARQ